MDVQPRGWDFSASWLLCLGGVQETMPYHTAVKRPSLNGTKILVSFAESSCISKELLDVLPRQRRRGPYPYREIESLSA